MTFRYDDLAPGEIYHICTRGVNKRTIFHKKSDYTRFYDLLIHCLQQGPIRSFSIAKRFKEKPTLPRAGMGLIDLLAFCPMPNHIHLLVKENKRGGTSLYMQRLLVSYTKYFNIRHKRTGPLYTSRFLAVLVDKDEQLLHVSRYIHLNPYVAHIVDDPFSYRWSSLNDYVGVVSKHMCHTNLINGMMNQKAYRSFVTDEADYARELSDIKHLLLDYND
ncbi:MAG: transposase [bacterium]